MLCAPMASPKKSTKKPTTKAASKPEGRKKSKLTLAGEEAATLAKRTLLLTTLAACRWNLSRTAEVLDLATGADVIRALKELAPEEYDAAKARGDVSQGRPREG